MSIWATTSITCSRRFSSSRTSIENAMRGRLDDDEATAKFGGLNLSAQELRQVDRIVLTACGTSWHAGLVGEYLIEEFARIPTEVEYASELRYRNPPLSDRTMVFAITQSGETADTLAAMRECQRKGHPSLAICNVVGSTIAREADGGIYLHAGPEIGVASTKAFTSQVTVLTLLALYLGRMRHLSYPAGKTMIRQLRAMPATIEKTLKCNEQVREVAAKYTACGNFLYLGRLYNFPVALEGALKLKEISYIHAEGYPAAEMKHGPIALVDQFTPSVFVVPQGRDLSEGDQQPRRSQGPQRPGDRHRLRRRRQSRRSGRRRDLRPRRRGISAAVGHQHPAATARLPHRGSARLQCRSPQKPRQERDGGVEENRSTSGI